MKRRSARLTKRLQRQYHSVLGRGSSQLFWPHPHACHSWQRTAPPNLKAWQAYLFAKEWQGRDGVDVKRLQRMVLDGTDGECMFLFARDVRKANVRRLQEAVTRCGQTGPMRRFMNLPGCDADHVRRCLLVAETLAD